MSYESSRYVTARPWRIVILLLAWWLGVIVAWNLYGEAQLPPLPTYGLELVTSAERASRPASAARWTGSSPLAVTLRPSEPVVGPVAVRAFLAADEPGGAVRYTAWAIPLQQTAEGVFALRARLEDLPDLAPGSWHLAFTVGRPKALPSDPRALRSPSCRGDWQLLEGRLLVEDG